MKNPLAKLPAGVWTAATVNGRKTKVRRTRSGFEVAAPGATAKPRKAGKRNPTNKQMTAWIKQTLANDESSSDAELLKHFVDQGVQPAIAKQWIKKRDQFLRGERNGCKARRGKNPAGHFLVTYVPHYKGVNTAGVRVLLSPTRYESKAAAQAAIRAAKGPGKKSFRVLPVPATGYESKRNGATAEKFKRYPVKLLRSILDAPASVMGSDEKAAARAELKRRGHA